MAVELSVRDVRTELMRAAGGRLSGDGEPSTRLLGTLFHEVFADLVGLDPTRSGVRVLLEAGPERDVAVERLVRHVYRVLVAPRLVRTQSLLQTTTPEVLSFWSAVQVLVGWLTDVARTLAAERHGQPPSWEAVTHALRPEVSIECTLRESGWSDAVRLTGIVDALLRVPGRSAWCAIELKLGRAHPAVDLGQVALYHLIAARAESGEAAGSVAVLRFAPALEETVVTAAELAEAQARLLDLVGRLAGVLPLSTPARKTSVATALDGVVDPVTPPGSPPVQSPTPALVPAATPAVREEHVELGRRVVRAFREYGRPIEIGSPPIVGPRFLRFDARLGPGVHFDHVRRLAAEVELKVGLRKAPIISREGGRLTIDVERPDPQAVPFASIAADLVVGDLQFGSSRLPVGVDVAGRLVCADLSSPINAHVLVAGTTGSGKTEWLRMAVAGLMTANTPETLRMVLFDPKLAAFSELRGSPYLWERHGLWVPGEDADAVDVLQDLVAEMERRYQLISAAGADDLARYRQATGARLPRIVCFCDEYFALVSQGRTQRRAIEAEIALLGSKARAAGIHLVLATQQPSRQIMQGVLDANMPCRVGLMMQSAIESRMLLHVSGAELLTGFGDLLYKDVGEPVRLQAPYLDPADRARIFAKGRAAGG